MTRITLAALKKIRRGHQSKEQGDLFEDLLKSTARRDGLGCVRIPNGCRSIGANRLVRQKSPFDFLVVGVPGMACLDAKTTAGDRLSFSAIPEHQIKDMIELGAFASVWCGFVIWFTATNRVEFFDVRSLKPRSSMIQGCGLMLGGGGFFSLQPIYTSLLKGPGINP